MSSNTVTIDRRRNAGGELDPDDPRAIAAAADAEAFEMFRDDDWRLERLQDFTETVYEGFEHENLVGYFSEVETVGENERITIEEVRGLRVSWVSLGGQIDHSDLDDTVWDMVQDYVGFRVHRHVKKMRNGFSHNAATLQNLAIQQMDAEISSRVFRTFQDAIPFGNDFYVGIPSMTKPAARTAITEVLDESKSGNITIVGRAPAINQLMGSIQDDNTFAPETQETLRRTGIVGEYWGATIVRLVNHKDADDIPFFPVDELWVLARDASKTGFWGGLTTSEWIDDPGFYWYLQGYREAGFAVHHPEYARRFVLSSLS